MNNPAQFDRAALAIVRPGVDGGLSELKALLEKFWANPSGQVGAIRSAQSEVKRMVGVFKMVALEGLSVYCDEIAAVLSELASHPESATSVHRDGVEVSLQALARYLDDLELGVDNATLRLFPPYQQLQHMRGLEMSFELDLFFPNLNVALPPGVLDQVQADNPQAQVKSARGQYQQALVRYLRRLDVGASLHAMQQAMLSVMAAFPANEKRAYWWVAAGFFDCLETQKPAGEINIPKLLGRIDQQMRVFLEAKEQEEQPELNQMLYFIASNPAVIAGVASAVSQTYDLRRYIYDANSVSTAMLGKRLSVIGEHLRQAEEKWDACVSGSREDCANFISQTRLIEQYCEKLDQETLQVLARAIAKYALYTDDIEHTQALSLDMAMALLLMGRGLVSYHQLPPEFQQQALALSERMYETVNAPSAQDKPITDLIALYCGQESSLVRSLLSKEMLANLQRVEAGLNDFFADESKRGELQSLSRDIKQIQGGLHILGLQSAAALSDAFLAAVDRLAKTDKAVRRAENRAIANALSALESYLTSLPHPGRSQEGSLFTASKELEKLNKGSLSNQDSTAAMSAFTINPVARSGDDFELIEIFLEEADEVLGIMRENLGLCNLHEVNLGPLVTIRRGFHTLKGSGSMVGLNELGEVAWGIERAMNFWLQDEQPVTANLLNMIDMAILKFSKWVDALHRNVAVQYDAGDLLALARQIETRSAPDAIAQPSSDMQIVEKHLAERIDIDCVSSVNGKTAEHESMQSLPVLDAVHAGVKKAATEEAESLGSVQIGTISLSGALFKIGSEESTQHVATLQKQLANLAASTPTRIEYDFMRAAHTLAGVNRAMGFTAIVDLAFALENWLLARTDHIFYLQAGQYELLQSTIATLDRMVQDLCARQFPRASSDQVYLLNMDKDKLHAGEVIPAVVETPLLTLVETPPALVEAPVAAAVETPAAAASKHPRAPLVQDEVDEQLLPLFMEEAGDLLPDMGESLRAWREQPDDTKHAQLLHRLLHTLKGSARMAGAMRIGQVAHEMEDEVLSAAKRRHDAAYWDSLDHEFDRITALLEELRTGKPAAQTVDLADARQRATDHVGVETAPDRRTPEIGAERALQGNMLRVRADVIDRLVNEASEISVARARMEGELRAFKDGLLELTESVNRLRKQLREVEIQAESQMQARVSLIQDSSEQFDPLEFDRFTRLQELTRFMNESVHDVQTVQHALLKNLDETTSAMSAQARLNRELQQSLMNVRMVPFNSITDRLYRIVRQTGKELNKRANLELSGAAVELDRSVLEKMTAPFEHLLRNAMAHGLESEQQRNQLGKQLIGEIRLSLRQENNEVVFELSDDGAGLDFAALRAKAIDQGLMLESDAATEEQLSQLIFASGISTAKEVTEVAGRGIGMDVVRSEIAALGGRIDVSSRSGKGTKFTIHLPLTLAVTQVLMVRCGDTTYAIPAAMVEQVRQVKSAEMEDLYRVRQIEWQGKHYPLHYLPQLLNAGAPVGENHPRNSVLLLRSGEARMALHIDELIGNQEAVVKNIGPQLARLPGIAGATVRGDGMVALILNPLQIAQNVFTSAPSKSAVAELPRRLPLVMVVDDSLTVRKITTRMLTRAGYEVVTAKDGVDALEQLADISPAVMLLDVEMPRMDGFELTKRLRQDSKTRPLPIIMITSRTADKHRDHALQLGVNAYLGKPYQEDDLLERIAGFVAAS
jgi:chemosensory pili system protein ChpA (sensor histidine kinase/response regulator)